eukprot:5341706-Pleurochrysis_carterae.AAC.4
MSMTELDGVQPHLYSIGEPLTSLMSFLVDLSACCLSSLKTDVISVRSQKLINAPYPIAMALAFGFGGG